MDGVCSVETHPVEGRFLVTEDIVFQEILCSAEGNVSEISICVCVCFKMEIARTFGLFLLLLKSNHVQDL